MPDETNHKIDKLPIDDPVEGDDELGQPIRYTISSYGADMPVDGLVDRLNREDVFIPPFQRAFVWTIAQASRFIESLLLGLPVPGIFLFKEPDTQKLMVVDGQQRLMTLQSFYKGLFGEKAFRLIGVSEEFSQRTYDTITPESQRYLNDSILHATIFQQIDPGNDRSSVYSVFERLNTGGTPLSQQEIRSCVYRGKLNDLLSDLAADPHWRNLYGGAGARKKDEEIILRFLSLYFCLETYERPMKRFLNDFMEKYRAPNDRQILKFRETFENAVKTTDTMLTRAALRPERALNVSVTDAVLVGLAHRLQRGPVSDVKSLKRAQEELLNKLRYEALYTEDTTHKDRVRKRIGYVRDAYETIQ